MAKTVTKDGDGLTIIAWHVPSSGIYDIFGSDYPNICQGATIFGVTTTASDCYCDVYVINFVEDADDYFEKATGIEEFHTIPGSAACSPPVRKRVAHRNLQPSTAISQAAQSK